MEGPFNVVIIFGVVMFFFLSSPEASSSLVTKTSLTTAKVSDGNLIPKPTSLNSFKRINVEPVKQSQQMGPHRRAGNIDSLRNVWHWDYWCQLQPTSGNCTARGKGNRPLVNGTGDVNRYYYEAQVDSCKIFSYSGCGGNNNNFATLAECEGHCKENSRLTLKETDYSIYCSLQPNVGMCMALVKRYYYHVPTNECKTFIYGGCGGNQNRFNNIEKCEERCKKNVTIVKGTRQ